MKMPGNEIILTVDSTGGLKSKHKIATLSNDKRTIFAELEVIDGNKVRFKPYLTCEKVDKWEYL